MPCRCSHANTFPVSSGPFDASEAPSLPVNFKRLLALIGAPKCGTSSVAAWLNASPDVVLAEGKEPGLFRTRGEPVWIDSRRHHRSTWLGLEDDAFQKAFPSLREDDWALDASTDYLSDESAPVRIEGLRDTITIKVLCLLRDPVDRAFSEYKHTLRDNLEHLSFREALQVEDERRREGFQPLFFHRRRSTYHADICRWRDLFGDRMMILPYTALKTPQRLVDVVCDFLQVSAPSLEEFPSENMSGTAPPSAWPDFIRRNIMLRRLRKTTFGRALESAARDIRTRRSRTRMVLQRDDARLLAEYLRDDIQACVGDPGIPTDDWWSPSLLTKS